MPSATREMSGHVLGIAAGAYDQALGYAQARHQFGRPIAEFQGLAWMLADMSIKLEASRALVWRAARSAGTGDGATGFPDRLAAAQAKVLGVVLNRARPAGSRPRRRKTTPARLNAASVASAEA